MDRVTADSGVFRVFSNFFVPPGNLMTRNVIKYDFNSILRELRAFVRFVRFGGTAPRP